MSDQTLDPATTYTAYCVHCRRLTVWLLVAIVQGKQYYKCVRCNCVPQEYRK